MYSCYLTWLQVWLPPWHFLFSLFYWDGSAKGSSTLQRSFLICLSTYMETDSHPHGYVISRVSDTSVCSGWDSTQLRLAPGNMSLMWIINVCVRGQGGYPTYTYLGSLFLEHGCWGTSHLKSEAKSTAKVRLLQRNDCGFYTFIILCVNVPSQAGKSRILGLLDHCMKLVILRSRVIWMQ